MRNQIIHTMASALLCVSGFAQTADISEEVPIINLQSTGDTVGWITTFAGDFEGAWKNVTEPSRIDGRTTGCALAGSRLLDIISKNRYGRQSREVPVWQLPASHDFFFVSGMTIDADGAPNAYNPDNTGLDDLDNAGAPGRWDGIVADRSGNALFQQKGDPFPGYYISCTSLSDQTKRFTDPAGYVNASKIPYVVLPNALAERGGVKLGDFAVVTNLRNGKSSFAIYADIGTIGEGSVALADALGIWSDARRGGTSDDILYLFFPGSGNQKPRTIDEIQSEGAKLLYRWGGTSELSSCLENYISVDIPEY
jgi:glycosyl hydrolase group 75 (putative chitosanase)